MEYIEYIKSLIEGILVGFSAPLPISSAIHMFLAEKLIGNNTDASAVSFYFDFFMLTFSVVLFFNFKNLYAKTFRGIADKEKAHITRGKNILITSAISLLLFIPVSKKGGLIYLFDSFISSEGVLSPLLVGIASIFSGIILLAVLESAKHSSCEKKNYVSRPGVLRMSLFSLLTYVVPGFSKIAIGSSNIVLADVAPAKALRECYFYDFVPKMYWIILPTHRLPADNLLFCNATLPLYRIPVWLPFWQKHNGTYLNRDRKHLLSWQLQNLPLLTRRGFPLQFPQFSP